MQKRLLLLRAVAAFLALPGVVALLVPLLIASPAIRDGVPFRWVALVPLLLGFGLLIWCVRLFLVQGKGTLAPWAPPRQIVVSGPYAFTRNPMYVAVIVMLIGPFCVRTLNQIVTAFSFTLASTCWPSLMTSFG